MSLFEEAAASAEHDHCADYFPVYFQACKGASPVMSGVYSLTFASLAPAAIATGLTVRLTGRYRPQMWFGWIITVVALALMSTIRATDPLEKSFGFVSLLGCGIGYVVFLVSVDAPG